MNTAKTDPTADIISSAILRDIKTVVFNIKDYLSVPTSEFKHINTMLDELAKLIHIATNDEKDKLCRVFGFVREAYKSDTSSLPDLSVAISEMLLRLFKRYLELYLKGIDIQNGFVEPTEDVLSCRGKIAYVKNNFTERAFWSFSKIISAPKALYSSNFEGACEDVFNGVAQFCILPIENSLDGKLISFYSLIDKYDLKIFLVCDIDHNDSSSETKFALLQKNLETLKIPHKHSSDVLLEISYTPSDSLSVLNILRAADFFSVNMIRIDSVRLAYSDDRYKFYSVFSAHYKQIISFLLYLYIFAPEFLPIGIYKRI